MQRLKVERSKVRWYQLRANHLGRRLPVGSLARAAFGGLQDSAPRAAIVALHARVEQILPGDWDDPSLVQTWAPRGAVFVVPRADLPIFALGISPRDPEVRSVLLPLVDAARRSVGEVRAKGGETEWIGRVPAPLAGHLRRRPIPRLVFALAGIAVRWDARSTSLLPSPVPVMDEEDARRELARRFVRSIGPAGPRRFTRWAAVSESDADATFEAISPELVDVEWPGGRGFLLADDAERLENAEPVVGIRLVPFGGDPVLQPGNEIVLTDESQRRDALPPWASTGLVLADDDVVAAWGRRKGRISLFALCSLDNRRRMQIGEEARSTPFGTAADPVWP